ncbi:helix-turn-helix transcriptional regulator [Pseudomonas sp. 3A(2025)]
MNLTDRIRDVHSPQFYLQLGELISSTGSEAFAASMFRLIDPLVPIKSLELSEWVLDERQACGVMQINPLGRAGATSAVIDRQEQLLLDNMLDMDDSLLIQLRAPVQHRPQYDSAHQCSLVSRNGNRRCVISLYRTPTQRLFSLTESSFLKSLSDTLLPLIERHAQVDRQATARKPGLSLRKQQALPLHQAFTERLALDEITLSAREQEVCLGLLTGGTVPQMAEKLKVKNSSVETYLKRAAAKLGVSGRHGLAKWMAGV